MLTWIESTRTLPDFRTKGKLEQSLWRTIGNYTPNCSVLSYTPVISGVSRASNALSLKCSPPFPSFFCQVKDYESMPRLEYPDEVNPLPINTRNQGIIMVYKGNKLSCTYAWSLALWKLVMMHSLGSLAYKSPSSIVNSQGLSTVGRIGAFWSSQPPLVNFLTCAIGHILSS